MLLGHKPNTTAPLLGRVVEDVVHLEPVWILLSELVELFFQKDVVQADVGVDEAELRLVEGALECCTDNLEHGRDTCSTGNHANLPRQEWVVLELTLRALNADLVANLEERDITGDVALLVRLDKREFRN